MYLFECSVDKGDFVEYRYSIEYGTGLATISNLFSREI